ncbi:MAG: Rab family GTPase [Promethearchaeota archaeon]
MEEVELGYKICIFGDSGVGKTTLVNRFITNQFSELLKSTLGAAIHIKYLTIENRRILLQIWDFGGEDRFRFLLPAYARGSMGAIFMYDITNFNSLKNIDGWLTVFRESLDEYEKKIPILMVGGKLDLKKDRQCYEKDVLNLLNSKGLVGHFECSSKTGENVESIFETMVREIMKRGSDNYIIFS